MKMYVEIISVQVEKRAESEKKKSSRQDVEAFFLPLSLSLLFVDIL